MTRTAVALAALSWLLIPPSPANAADWAAVVQRTAPAIVNLKITVRSESESGGEPEESTQEVQGALVDPSGLVLVWNSHFSANRFLDLLAEMGGGDFKMKVTPTDIRVYLDGGATEHKAFLAAADTDLDLAFVQIEEPPVPALPAVDFSDAAPIRAGDELAAVSRLSSAFDRVPYFDVVRVAGEIRKPRPAWIVTAGNATQLGMPYFAADGRAAGVLVTVMSKAKSDALSNPSNLMADLLSLGRGEVEVGPLGVFLLPAEKVRSVIEQARQRARELLAERAAQAAPQQPD
jgi:dipeptidyl aminopeptidase/acylaminoacyl peptidase